MNKAARRLNNAAVRTGRRSKSRKAKVRFITRAEARRRAERHVLNRMFKGGAVQDGAKARMDFFRPSDLPSWKDEEVWVVYKNPERFAFMASQVVLVCKRTGRVVYEGSAGDEG